MRYNHPLLFGILPFVRPSFSFASESPGMPELFANDVPCLYLDVTAGAWEPLAVWEPCLLPPEQWNVNQFVNLMKFAVQCNYFWRHAITCWFPEQANWHLLLGMERFETVQLNDTLKHKTAASFLSVLAFVFLASTDDIFLLFEVVPFHIK